MHSFIILFISLIAFLPSFGQNSKVPKANIDSSELLKTAIELYKNGKLELVDSIGKILISLDSSNYSGYGLRASYFKSIEKYDSAIYYANQANALLDFFSTRLEVAKLYRKLGKDLLQLKEINRAIYLEKYLGRASLLDLVWRGVIPSTDTLIFDPYRQNIALKARKDWYWEHHQYDSALSDMQEIVKFQPYANYYYEYGKMQYELGKYKLAIDQFDKALNVDNHILKDSTSLYAYKASALGKLGNSKDALWLYRATRIHIGTNDTFYYLRGWTFWDLGEKDSACSNWLQAIKLGMEIPEYKINCK